MNIKKFTFVCANKLFILRYYKCLVYLQYKQGHGMSM